MVYKVGTTLFFQRHKRVNDTFLSLWFCASLDGWRVRPSRPCWSLWSRTAGYNLAVGGIRSLREALTTLPYAGVKSRTGLAVGRSVSFFARVFLNGTNLRTVLMHMMHFWYASRNTYNKHSWFLSYFFCVGRILYICVFDLFIILFHDNVPVIWNAVVTFLVLYFYIDEYEYNTFTQFSHLIK